jgi:hypothetical protein
VEFQSFIFGQFWADFDAFTAACPESLNSTYGTHGPLGVKVTHSGAHSLGPFHTKKNQNIIYLNLVVTLLSKHCKSFQLLTKI